MCKNEMLGKEQQTQFDDWLPVDRPESLCAPLAFPFRPPMIHSLRRDLNGNIHLFSSQAVVA